MIAVVNAMIELVAQRDQSKIPSQLCEFPAQASPPPPLLVL